MYSSPTIELLMLSHFRADDLRHVLRIAEAHGSTTSWGTFVATRCGFRAVHGALPSVVVQVFARDSIRSLGQLRQVGCKQALVADIEPLAVRPAACVETIVAPSARRRARGLSRAAATARS